MSKKHYEVSEAELFDLIETSIFLDKLYDAGLDNWEGHDYSLLPDRDLIMEELENYPEAQ